MHNSQWVVHHRRGLTIGGCGWRTFCFYPLITRITRIFADYFWIIAIGDDAERRHRSAAVPATGALRIANAINEGTSSSAAR
jgi:hypothetical protein